MTGRSWPLRTDAITLHNADVPTRIRSWAGVPVFDDGASTYCDPSNPLAGVKITDTNTRIKITKEPLDGSTISLQVGPSAKWIAFTQVRSASAVTPWRVAADRV